jgi:quercetin dioxygenase-like cupin family protein
VIEGRGSTEVWQEGQVHPQTFEWQKGSMYSIPLNAFHRFVNATNSPALLLCGTSAPNMFNLLDNTHFIFNCPYNFNDRYNGTSDYFQAKEDVLPDPVRGLAMRRTNFLPDVISCELPLDNRRSPGYRRVEPHMAGNRFYQWIGQHETGRYSKAHKHASAAVLICLKGKGYTYTWPEALGVRPWESGKAEHVKRQDYEFGGMVTAAMFYFLTAVAFLAVGLLSVRDAMAGKAGALTGNLNLAFATFLGLVGAYLLWYGVQLLTLGGSFAYALSGVALLATTYFLIMRKPLGAMIYAGIVVLWVALSIVEAGLDFMALLPRLAAWLVVGLWFLSPWHRTAMGKTAETPINAGGLWVGGATAAGALLLVVAALQAYPVVDGTKNEVAAGPAVTDWRNYGGVPEGQRFAQITQINVENVGKLARSGRWSFTHWLCSFAICRLSAIT